MRARAIASKLHDTKPTTTIIEKSAPTRRDARTCCRPTWSLEVDELAWLEENEHTLGEFAGLWVAIRGTVVVASGASFDEVYDEACRLNRADALIVPIPEAPDEPTYLIA